MGYFKNTLPYGTIGDEWDGPIPVTYRLPSLPATSPASQGPVYYCVCHICGAVIGETRPDQQPEPWRQLQRQRVDHINDTHRVYPDYPYPDFEAWERRQPWS